MADQVGQFDIRGENISRIVNVYTQKQFKIKNLFKKVKSNNWTETYYQEDPTILTAAGTRNIKEIGRLSEFPTVNRSWTKVSAVHLKYGAESEIAVEDIWTDAIPVQARALNGIAESIANSIDVACYAALTAATGTSGVVAAVAEWDAAVVADRDPIQDILRGIQAMSENNVDILGGGMGRLLLNPHDYASLMMNSKVINNPSFKTADIVSNGKVGQICGLDIVVSTSVTDDEAMIIIDQKSADWKFVTGMSTAVIVEEGIKTIIRSWEVGQINIINPKTLYTITGTEA